LPLYIAQSIRFPVFRILRWFGFVQFSFFIDSERNFRSQAFWQSPRRTLSAGADADESRMANGRLAMPQIQEIAGRCGKTVGPATLLDPIKGSSLSFA